MYVVVTIVLSIQPFKTGYSWKDDTAKFVLMPCPWIRVKPTGVTRSIVFPETAAGYRGLMACVMLSAEGSVTARQTTHHHRKTHPVVESAIKV